MGLLIYSLTILLLLFVADKYNDFWTVETNNEDVTIILGNVKE